MAQDPSALSLCPQTLASTQGALLLAPTSKIFRDNFNGVCETEGWKCQCDYYIPEVASYPQLINFAWIDKSDYVEEEDDCVEFFSQYNYAEEWSDIPNLLLDPSCSSLRSHWFFYRDPDEKALVALFREPLSHFTPSYIQSQAFPFYEIIKDRAVNSDCSEDEEIDLSARSWPNPCPTETYTTLMKNAWPEIGDADYAFFLAGSEKKPEEDILVRYYLSLDSTLSDEDIVLADFNLSASEFYSNDSTGEFSFGEVIEFYVDGAISSPNPSSLATINMDNIQPGEYYLIESIDPDNEIEETDESNNISPHPNRIVISEFVGGDCNCCPATIVDEQGNIGELVTDVPRSMFSSSGGRVIYRTDSDSYEVSCGY